MFSCIYIFQEGGLFMVKVIEHNFALMMMTGLVDLTSLIVPVKLAELIIMGHNKASYPLLDVVV